MYAFIRGVLFAATPQHCILDVHGVGYKLFIPASAFGKLPTSGSELLLHSAYVVREQSQALFGFLTCAERDLFEQLLNISGIGPKIALSIIGHLTLAELKQAFTAGDSGLLCKIPGIGKKGAERLIVEMRDKVKGMTPPEPLALAIAFPGDQQTIDDAVSALMHLGYTHAVAQKAIQRSVDLLPGSVDLAMLITTALKHI
jgi:Holliday junction DNA helicase RuvA